MVQSATLSSTFPTPDCLVHRMRIEPCLLFVPGAECERAGRPAVLYPNLPSNVLVESPARNKGVARGGHLSAGRLWVVVLNTTLFLSFFFFFKKKNLRV